MSDNLVRDIQIEGQERRGRFEDQLRENLYAMSPEFSQADHALKRLSGMRSGDGSKVTRTVFGLSSSSTGVPAFCVATPTTSINDPVAVRALKGLKSLLEFHRKKIKKIAPTTTKAAKPLKKKWSQKWSLL